MTAGGYPIDVTALRRRAANVTAALALTVISSAVFIAMPPRVGDLWAAMARQAAARAGVGLSYWFSWYAGGSAPGSYSVLTPWLSAAIGAPLLAGLSTVATVGLTHRAVRGTAHAHAALWVVTIVAAANLWSGRVPFAVASTTGLLAILAMRSGRRWSAAGAGVLTILFSPLAGAFLVLGAGSAAVAVAKYRGASIVCTAASGATLIAVGVWFGMPGAMGFSVWAALASSALLACMLLARPSRAVTLAIIVTAAAIPVAAVVPNGVGSNILRLIYLVLPAGVVATSRARKRIVAIAVLPALAYCLSATIRDLTIAAAPNSQPAYYTALKTELTGRGSELTNHRLEVVANGTHAAAYELLDQATLARGYETQADNALDRVLNTPAQMTADAYRQWLGANAVAFVALDRAPLQRSAEFTIITREHPAYLQPVWSDAHWQLYRVADATQIVPNPAQFVSSDQAHLVVSMAGPATVVLRVHWSHLLTVDRPPGGPPAQLQATPDGWTQLTVIAAGTYTMHGRGP